MIGMVVQNVCAKSNFRQFPTFIFYVNIQRQNIFLPFCVGILLFQFVFIRLQFGENKNENKRYTQWKAKRKQYDWEGSKIAIISFTRIIYIIFLISYRRHACVEEQKRHPMYTIEHKYREKKNNNKQYIKGNGRWKGVSTAAAATIQGTVELADGRRKTMNRKHT